MEVKRIYVFSPGLRLWHWVNFLSILTLFITGLYIGNPFFLGPTGYEATYAYDKGITMDFIRKVHFIAGYVFLSGFSSTMISILRCQLWRPFGRPLRGTA